MSDFKVLVSKCKEVFTSKRSASVPSTTVPVEEVVPSDFTDPKRTLRRSKSGRVKVMARTRSLVSTYDFSSSMQENIEEKQIGKKAEGANSAEILKRIERTWPGLEGLEVKKENIPVSIEDK